MIIEWVSPLKEFWSNCAQKLKLKPFPSKLILLKGDASLRKYYRIQGEQFSFILCYDANMIDERSDFIQLQRFLKLNQIRVPEIYFTDFQHNLLLEEDCGDLTLLQILGGLQKEEEELSYYKKAIELLIALQLSPPPDYPLVAYERFFDADKLFFEINFCNSYFLQKFLKLPQQLNAEQKVAKAFTPIIEQLIKPPFALTHRDYHSKNLLVKEGELVVIDFQDARMGRAQYDLVSLLDDCYYDLLTSHRDQLIRYYYDLSPIKKTISFEEFHYIYHLMAVQRVYKAIGSFAYLYDQKNSPYYIKYIGFAMEKIKKILWNYPEFDSLRQLLLGYYYGH